MSYSENGPLAEQLFSPYRGHAAQPPFDPECWRRYIEEIVRGLVREHDAGEGDRSWRRRLQAILNE